MVPNVAGNSHCGESCADLRGPHRPDTQSGLSNVNGNFTVALSAGGKHTPFAICAHSLYRRRTGSSAGVTQRVTRCQQTKPRQTYTNTSSCSHRPTPPRLPPMLTRFILLPLRPPLSGLDSHHCRVEVTFIHGHDRRPSPGEGVGGTEGKNKHTSSGFKSGWHGSLSVFCMHRASFYTRNFRHISFEIQPGVGQ